MDLLDRLLGHDAWTTRELLRLSAGLGDAELDREFDLGLRTLRATLAHIVRNTEVWSALMAGEAAPEGGASSVAHLIERHEAASIALARVARGVRAVDGWDAKWVDSLDDPPREKTFGGAIAHVLTHSMHHRCQALFMLRRLGVEGVPEGDVLSWEGRER